MSENGLPVGLERTPPAGSGRGKRGLSSAVLSVDAPIGDLPGVPTAVASTLESALGLKSIGDLLKHYPRRYEDRTQFKLIADVRHGDLVTIRGKVASCENIPTRSRMTLTKVGIDDGSGTAYLVFFNQWFVKRQFERYKNRTIIAYGKASRAGRAALELSDVEWEPYDHGHDALSADRIVPIYPAAEGVHQARLRKACFAAVEACADHVEDRLPHDLRLRRHLASASDAVRNIHFPADEAGIETAKRRLVYDEFVELQLVLALKRRQDLKQTGNVFVDAEGAVAELRSVLPFALTAAQERAIREIATDMRSDRAMNRLVQGDVGSGKTVVAVAALLIAVRNGFQAALMAPTEILAEQHYLGLHRILEALRIKVIMLTGSLTPRQKKDALDAIAMGLFEVVVGTHALIQDEVRFANLGLAVVDEQHRFGVMQRAALRGKGKLPELLVMTATPIPRTLTLTVYGDLDVTIIDQLPPGRKPIKTHWKRGAERQQVYESLRALLKEGRQAYVICSLIEENDKLQARAATEMAGHLQTHVFPEFKVGLLHGQMKAAEKEEIMGRFRDRALDILVSTTVIEVGVDVPNASVIIIEDADRFGLAQLHQLRGRVGRGSTQSYCLLIGDPKTDVGESRLKVMESSTDGFVIAEEDLKLRGPGDFYGTRQSGMQDLPFLDVVRDVPTLNEAREDAFAMLADDPQMRRPEHKLLKARVRERYHEFMGALVS